MDNARDTFSDVPDPENRRRRRSRLDDDADESAGTGSAPEEFDADALLPGAVFMVPNRHWGFEVVSAADHPGACTHYQPGAKDATLVKGTDADNVRNRRGYFFVDASEENGLEKRTALRLVPEPPFRLHRLKLYFPERHLGYLEAAVLHALRVEMARLHPEE
jgi:hypothetical protein